MAAENVKNKPWSRPAEEEPLSRMALPLALMIGVLLMNFVGRMGMAPLMPAIEADLQISHARAGGFFLIMGLGFPLGMISSGWVSARINHHRTIVLTGISNGLMMILIGLAQSDWLMQAALFLSGLTSGFYMPSGMAIITSAIRRADWGKALSLQQLAPNISFVISPFLAEIILGWFNWRLGLTGYGVISIACGLAFARWGKGGWFPGQAPNLRSLGRLFSQPGFWLVAFLFSIALSNNQGLFAIIPLYLTSEMGLTISQTNTLIAISRVLGLATPLLSGWLADRIGLKPTIAGVVLLTGAATLWISTAPAGLILIPMIIQAMCGVCIFPLTSAVLAQITTPQSRGLAIAMSVPIAQLTGVGLVPFGLGILGDFGRFEIGIGLLGVITLAGLALIFKVSQDQEINTKA